MIPSHHRISKRNKNSLMSRHLKNCQWPRFKPQSSWQISQFVNLAESLWTFSSSRLALSLPKLKDKPNLSLIWKAFRLIIKVSLTPSTTSPWRPQICFLWLSNLRPNNRKTRQLQNIYPSMYSNSNWPWDQISRMWPTSNTWHSYYNDLT